MSMTHKGWHSRGYLPHFDSAETIQFITFRLFDSLPRAVAEALAKQPDNLAKTDERLDGGLGACWLGEPAIAELVENTILHFDGERYRVLAWCVMPNHVHVVVEPVDGNRLGDIVHSWKSYSANRANSILGRTGPFWHKDFFDRFIRDESHLARTIDYVENNPVKAGLVRTAGAWPWGSGRFRA
jgi:REP element-mobilizing transposase RayT